MSAPSSGMSSLLSKSFDFRLSTNMVSIQHISKSFGSQKVLNDVSLEIPAGQIVGLLGPNGAGKSTLMKILIGLWSADSGTVSAPARIGYLPENNPLYEDMYVT